MASDAESWLAEDSPFAGGGAALLSLAASQASPLLRQRYGLLQADQRLAQSAWTLRYLHGFDDGGGRLTGVLEWQTGDHTMLFALAQVGIGGRDVEFRRYQSRMLMAGLRWYL